MDLSHNKITDENFEYFQTYPKDNLTLEEFDISSNYISDKSAKVFFKNLEENNNILKLNFFDNHLGNESAEAIMEILKTNHNILNINVGCNNIGLKVMNEMKEQIQNNKIIKKEKYIPKLRNELKELEFNPDEINYLKNKIDYTNKEREFMEKKFIKEIKDIENKKKENIKSAKDVDNLKKNIEKNIEALKHEWIKLKEDEIKEKDFFEKEVISMKEKISEIENEIKDINYIKYNLKHNYNEEIGLLKHTYDQTLQKQESNKLGILSLNEELQDKNIKYREKLEYLEKLKLKVSSTINTRKKNSSIKLRLSSRLKK